MGLSIAEGVALAARPQPAAASHAGLSGFLFRSWGGAEPAGLNNQFYKVGGWVGGLGFGVSVVVLRWGLEMIGCMGRRRARACVGFGLGRGLLRAVVSPACTHAASHGLRTAGGGAGPEYLSTATTAHAKVGCNVCPH